MKTWKFILGIVCSAGILAAQNAATKLAQTAANKSTSASTGTQASANPTATPGNTRWSERRDPFVSALRLNAGGEGSGCSVGKRCLTADEIILRGIVVTQDRGNIALVENSERRSTVLFVNDQIFHGSVVKITNDSLVLRVIVTDEVGKKTTRDIVKRVTTPAV